MKTVVSRSTLCEALSAVSAALPAKPTTPLDGSFPDFDNIVHNQPTMTSQVNVRELKAALSRINIIASKDKYNAAKFHFSAEGLAISSFAHEVGKVTEHVNADVDGDLSIAFDFHYFDFLKILESENVLVEGTESLANAKFRELGNDDFVYVLTPLRTRD